MDSKKRIIKTVFYVLGLVVCVTALVFMFYDTINAAIDNTKESKTMTEISTTAVVDVVTELETEITTEVVTTTEKPTTTETTTETTTKKQTTTTETTTEKTTEENSSDKIYSASYFKKMGELHWGGFRWTWYSENVLPGNGLHIPGRHRDDDKYICDENDYICLASDDYSDGTVIDTPLGKKGKVYDHLTDDRSNKGTIDVYVGW